MFDVRPEPTMQIYAGLAPRTFFQVGSQFSILAKWHSCHLNKSMLSDRMNIMVDEGISELNSTACACFLAKLINELRNRYGHFPEIKHCRLIRIGVK